MSAQVVRISDYRRTPHRLAYDRLPNAPEPPPNLWAEAIAWWLAWSAESAQVAADNLHAMSKALRGPR